MTDFASARPFALALADFRRSLPVIASPFRLRDERPGDRAGRETLLDAAFGPERFAKTCERLREGRIASEGLSFVAVQGGRIVGTLRFWSIEAGDRAGLMLGPLAVCGTLRSAGIGRALMDHGLRRAHRLGHGSVILVGDAPYYGRFGFARAHTVGLTLPGPVDDARFLGLELVPGALMGAKGRVVGAGMLVETLRGGRDRRLAA